MDGYLAVFIKDDAVHCPFCVGYCLGTNVLHKVGVIVSHVNHGFSGWPVFISIDIVGLNGDFDDTGVTCIIVKHERNRPLFALSATCCRRKVGLTEVHDRHGVCVVTGHSCRHGRSVPRSRSGNNPIGMECLGCGCGVGEGQVCIALHVTQFVSASAWVDTWHLIVNLQVQSVAKCSKPFWVWCDLVGKHVSKQRQG